MRKLSALMLIALVSLMWSCGGEKEKPEVNREPAEVETGPAPVERDGKWGFADVDGKILIEPRYDEVRRFHDGLAAVRRGKEWNFINERGRYVGGSSLMQADDFKDGLARVRVDGNLLKSSETPKWGVLDRNGRWAIRPIYDELSPFVDGRATARIADKTVTLERPEAPPVDKPHDGPIRPAKTMKRGTAY